MLSAAQEGTYIVTLDLADIGDAGVGGGDDLDELRILNRVRPLRGELSPEVDAPVGAEPHQALNRDDGSDPDEGPFLGADVLLVQLRAHVVAQEDGPDDRKRPYIGVPLQGQRRVQLGRLDLGVVDERRHGGGGGGEEKVPKEEDIMLHYLGCHSSGSVLNKRSCPSQILKRRAHVKE